MVTGRKPFVAESPMAVLRMHMDDPPLPLRKVPKVKVSSALDSAVLRALEKDPARRWSSAAEFSQGAGGHAGSARASRLPSRRHRSAPVVAKKAGAPDAARRFWRPAWGWL